MTTAAYECDRCGACCRSLIIEIDELDLIREPRLIPVTKPFRQPEGTVLTDDDGELYVEVVPGFGSGGMLACGKSFPCQLLGPDNACGIYPARPNVCVSFRAGSEQCQDARRLCSLPPLEAVSSGAKSC